MTKQDFLEKLRLSLGGRLSSMEIQEHISYYEDYINTEIRKGRSEAEVLAALGEPRLIAKTIAETAEIREDQAEADSETYGGYDTYENSHSVRREDSNRSVRKVSGLPAWVWLILILVIVVVILSTVFSLLAAVLPVLLPILFVLFLVKVFRDWLN